jgi:membrane protease YdiL (CAAX protease family)
LIAYLAAIVLAEAATRLGAPVAGMLVAAGVVMAAINQAAGARADERALLLGLALLPLSRLVALALPLDSIPASLWVLVAVTPMALGTALAIRVSGYRAIELGLTVRGHAATLSLAVAAPALAVGAATYGHGLTLPGVDRLPPDESALGLVTFWVGAALLDEVIFRGFLQRALQHRVGGGRAAVLSGVLFGLLAADVWNPMGLSTALAAGMTLSLMRHWTRSIAPGLVAHTGLVLGALLVALIAR